MEDKEAKENTGTKEGMTRDEIIPVDTFVGVATCTGQKEVNSKNLAATDEDQG